jgi:CRP-like cAMP-binding protein
LALLHRIATAFARTHTAAATADELDFRTNRRLAGKHQIAALFHTFLSRSLQLNQLFVQRLDKAGQKVVVVPHHQSKSMRKSSRSSYHIVSKGRFHLRN